MLCIVVNYFWLLTGMIYSVFVGKYFQSFMKRFEMEKRFFVASQDRVAWILINSRTQGELFDGVIQLFLSAASASNFEGKLVCLAGNCAYLLKHFFKSTLFLPAPSLKPFSPNWVGCCFANFLWESGLLWNHNCSLAASSVHADTSLSQFDLSNIHSS